MERAELPYAFTRRQAIESGLSDFRIQRMISRDELVRVRHGVFVRARTPTPANRAARYLDLARALVDVYGEGFALCHLSAAAADGLPLPLGSLDTVHLLDLSPSAKSRRGPA
jgi:hypothetical protein